MSAFLGPIHHWLYRKIQFQEQLIQQLIQFGYQKDLLSAEYVNQMDHTYGTIPAQPLEEIIDESNIHGWLQEKVSLVEYRLASVVTCLVKQTPEVMTDIQSIAFQYGCQLPLLIGSPMQATEKTPVSPKECFDVLSNTLLDGMPCDRAISLSCDEDTCIEWTRNLCVHQNYWDEIGGSIAHYLKIQESIIDGILSQTPFHCELISSEPPIYRIL